MKRRPIAILTALVAALAGIVVLRLSVGLVPSTPPPARDEDLLAGFTVTEAPDQFEQVLMIVEIPPLTWTPLYAPAGVNQQGFSSNGYLYFGPGYRGPDTVALPIGPTVVERASIIVDRPASAFQVVQRLMESNGEHGRVQ